MRVAAGAGPMALVPEAQALPDGQADSSTPRAERGSGLGLTICKQIVSLMSGRIGVRSALGRRQAVLVCADAAGSGWSPEIVDLAIPLAAAPGWQVRSVASADEVLADALLTTPVTTSTLYNAMHDPRAPGAQPLAGLRMSVVDDSAINRDVAASILADAGAPGVLAENGSIAVDWLATHPYGVDLMLIGVQMRGMARPYKAPWSIAQITAYLMENSRKHFTPALVDCFLTSLPTLLDVRSRWQLREGESHAGKRRRHRQRWQQPA